MLLRQATPQAGSVGWGGHALADYTLATLRGAISWVPQESFLFSATIAENIALGRARTPAAREIEYAAGMAAIHDDILRFPQGLRHPASAKRASPCRAASASAWRSPAPCWPPATLLLLDDALSAVDTGTETRILEHLEELRRKRPERSAIIASHRLSAVVNADLIVVLREGRIAEQGTHDGPARSRRLVRQPVALPTTGGQPRCRSDPTRR